MSAQVTLRTTLLGGKNITVQNIQPRMVQLWVFQTILKMHTDVCRSILRSSRTGDMFKTVRAGIGEGDERDFVLYSFYAEEYILHKRLKLILKISIF